MPMTNPDLWMRISGLEIGPQDAVLSFCARLARENGWPADYARKVIAEYKRFIYLVLVSNQELTPSDQVDQAWHLHMAYTHSYWHDLCRDILGRELHHLPTQGGASEQARFRAQYEQTLRIYTGEFGQHPPAALWPPVQERFDRIEDFVRINRASSWVMKRPKPILLKGLAMTAFAFSLVGCTEDPDGYGIWFWLKLAFGLFVLYKVFSWLDSGGRGGGSGGSGCGGCAGCGGGD